MQSNEAMLEQSRTQNARIQRELRRLCGNSSAAAAAQSQSSTVHGKVHDGIGQAHRPLSANCGIHEHYTNITYRTLYPMPTAVPATVPPSRLCTKFVSLIVFGKEVLGTISFSFVISMRPVLCLPKHTPKIRNTGRNAHHFIFRFGVKESIRTLPPFVYDLLQFVWPKCS